MQANSRRDNAAKSPSKPAAASSAQEGRGQGSSMASRFVRPDLVALPAYTPVKPLEVLACLPAC